MLMCTFTSAKIGWNWIFPQQAYFKKNIYVWKKAQSIRKCRKMMLLLFSAKGKIFFRNLHYKFTFRFRPLLSTSKRYLMEKMKNVTNLIARKIKETPYYLRSLTYRFFFQSSEIRRSTQYQVITKEKENMWFFLLRGNEVFVWNIVLFLRDFRKKLKIAKFYCNEKPKMQNAPKYSVKYAHTLNIAVYE